MQTLSELIKSRHTAFIAGHSHPDGDCVGSCMALYLYLKENAPQLKVSVFMEEIPPIYTFLSGCGEVRGSYDRSRDGAPDIFFALDCGDRARVAVAGEAFGLSPVKIVIDHHISNPGYGDINCIEPHASSTSEVLYELFKEDRGRITREIAEGLYLGIIQDTGVFQYSSTSSRTMQIAGELMDMGIDYPTIVEESFFQKTFLQNRIYGRVLMDADRLLDGRLLYSILRKETIDEYGVKPSDLDGIVGQLRNTKDVEVAAFIYEVKEGAFKVSLRAKQLVDVSRIALSLGGGGHRFAAAAVVEGDAKEILSRIAAMVEEQLLASQSGDAS